MSVQRFGGHEQSSAIVINRVVRLVFILLGRAPLLIDTIAVGEGGMVGFG